MGYCPAMGPLHHSASLNGPPPRAGEDFLDRVVVGVDPPASADGDACGIVVAGRRDGKLYVLADLSVEGASPERWARAVAGAAAAWGASHVVAEANQGGAMVASVLKAADAGLKVKLVHASRGKVARAEPVAIRFETGRAFLAGIFPELEAELAGLMVGGGYEGPSRSPDRADACVWALTELSETQSGIPRIRML
jgi:phage terminase large subunit-like protein